jgi:hypothetical protein
LVKVLCFVLVALVDALVAFNHEFLREIRLFLAAWLTMLSIKHHFNVILLAVDKVTLQEACQCLDIFHITWDFV